ncbi:uncharacterized protein LOC112000312 [Quercus suber]|uniref:uncharacterized protein LOC112000312 n=1 Tax=Quercus suber TaxID=58331 RepID=UPI0032DF4973
MIDTASGGALVDKTPEATRNLITNMAANSQQFGTRLDPPSKHVNEANISSLEQQIASLTSLVRQMVVGNKQIVKACGICLALAESRKYEQNKDLYETFRRCEVNIPLLDAIKQVPHYAKFLKELCTIKRKQKLKGCNTQLEKAMLDLGASINVMPYSIYVSLKLGPLNKTGVVIQLADRSIAYPKGVLVQVNDLVFPANFYVLDMENGDQTTPILLGRPFLKTSKTKIDVHSGTLTMKFNGEIEAFELDGKDGLEVAISKHLEKENEELALSTDLQETIAALNDFLKLQQSGNVPYITLPVSNDRPLPSVLQAPIPDLKPLPCHLKYVFLRDGGTLPVIISNKLSAP